MIMYSVDACYWKRLLENTTITPTGVTKDRQPTCTLLYWYKSKNFIPLRNDVHPGPCCRNTQWLLVQSNICFWEARKHLFIKNMCWAPWISQVEKIGLPSIFIKAQPCYGIIPPPHPQEARYVNTVLNQNMLSNKCKN